MLIGVFKIYITLNFLEFKIFYKSNIFYLKFKQQKNFIVNQKLTGLDTWVEGKVIDIENNPFKGIVIAIEDEKAACFLEKKNISKKWLNYYVYKKISIGK